MKKFREIQPEDAEVLRNSKWIRYDAASLVRGDIIKVMEGDIIPADCVILSLDESEMLVDMRIVTGEEKTTSIVAEMEKLYYGGRVLQGSAVAAVVAIGPDTLVANLIRKTKFPPKTSVFSEGIEDVEAGISLIENRLS
jgi:P-type E1-E2 ATPase